MKTISIRLFFISLSLICVGFVMIFSSSSVYAQELFDSQYYFLKRQSLHFGLGMILQLFLIKFDYKRWKKAALPLLFFSICLLLLVFIPGIGHSVGGARRWISVASIQFQPSEFVKLAFVIYLAAALDRQGNRIRMFFGGLLPLLLVLGFVVGLIFIQPDFGTTVLLASVSLILLYVCGANFFHLTALFLAALPAVYVAVWNTPYRRKRILSFLNPWEDPSGSGYQIIQSLIALGSGALKGKGLGQSTQKLFYLPEAHTDFIFSIIGEEGGLLGSLFILFLFCLLFWYALQVVWYTKDAFGYALALGILLLLSLQTFIHIGVVTSSLPPKGITLPFISYGGSSLIMNMAAMGILINISKSVTYPRSKRRKQFASF